MVRIAVVIPALHEADRIRTAVESAQGPGVDVIVADGGSVDGTQQRAREGGARVVDSVPGRAQQLAAGLAAAGDADAILFLHADTELPHDWFDLLRSALADLAAVGGAFGFALRGEGFGLRIIEAWVRVRLFLFALPYGDQGLFGRRTAIEAMGGVPQVPIMEDLDLVRGLRRQGRMIQLRAPAVSSPRRYQKAGSARTVVRNLLALVAWRLDLDRDRVAAWYRR